MEVIRVVLKYLSPTAINTYLACPRKFYLRYVKKLKTKPSIYLVRGSIVHKVIEEFNQAAGPEPTSLTDTQVIIRLLKLFQKEWTAAEPRLVALNLPADELKVFHDESQIMLINYGYWFHGRRAPKPLATESRFYSRNLGLMGIVDAIYRFGERDILVDYKTSKKAEINPDMERQAAVYALLFEDKHGRPPEAVWIHFVKFNQDPLVINVDETLLNYGRILTESIRKQTNSTNEADYPCTCGGWCERDFIKE